MSKFTTTVLTTLMLGASLSALADDGMKGMDMSKMSAGSSMHGMDMGNMKKKSSLDAKVAHGVGVIKSIDVKTAMITLNHQAIKELNWPPMSMGFKVADPKLLDGLKVGQKVAFELKSQGTKEVVTAITVVK
ncbi:MAG: copper-binding protein [Flavobacteriales bacterium]